MVSFDIISDLNLSDGDQFDWTDAVISPYCIVAGGVSQHLDIVRATLEHLSGLYAAVFYVDGGLEHQAVEVAGETADVIREFCKKMNHVYYLYGQAIVVDGVAVMGLNGWYANKPKPDSDDDLLRTEVLRLESINYLNKTVMSLQTHRDVREIVMVTACLPAAELMFGQTQYAEVPEPVGPALSLAQDTERKIKNWVYGGYPVSADLVIGGVRYLCNPRVNSSPYWAKQLLVSPQLQL